MTDKNKAAIAAMDSPPMHRSVKKNAEDPSWMPRGRDTQQPMQMQRHNGGPFCDLAEIADNVGAHA